jgi:PAS domain S-box-containing protein
MREDARPGWITRLLSRGLDLAQYADPVERFRAETTGFVVFSYAAFSLLVVIGLAFEEGANHPGLSVRTERLIASSATLAFALPVAALRRGWIDLANALVIAIAFGGATAATLLNGSIPNPGLYAFALVVASAGVLLNGPAAVAVAVGSLATVFVLTGASAPGTPVHDDPWHHILSLAVVAGLTSAIVVRARERAQAAIVRAVGHQQALRERSRELGAQEARFDAIARSSNEMIAEFDDKGRIVYASPNHRDLVGRDPSDLIGLRAVDLIHPLEFGDGDRFPEVEDDSGSPPVFRIRASDGSWRWFEITTSRYVAADGSRRMVTVARDKTVRVAEEAREAQRRDAESHAQKMEAIGRLAGGITHELNNLMTVITLNVEMLTAAAPVDPETAESLDHIRQSADHASSLIRRLLAFARPADGARTTVELNGQIRDIGRLLGPLVGETITFDLDLDDEAGFVEADTSELGQLLMNLVVNARDAIRYDGAISIRTRRVDLAEPRPCYSGPLPAGSYASLCVEDSGIGMSDETRERLFEPFFTTRASEGGTGLGLAMVYAIVRRAGGDLEVAGRKGGGTRITAFLPRLDAPETEAEVRATESRVHRGQETVLVVEDQDYVRAATARVVRSLGYRVLEAGSGEEALEMERTIDTPIDLLLTDVVMPGLKGPELARRFVEQRPVCRVLYLTGFADRAFGPGSSPDHPMLIKPVGRQVLATRLRALLDDPAAPDEGRAGAAGRNGAGAGPPAPA